MNAGMTAEPARPIVPRMLHMRTGRRTRAALAAARLHDFLLASDPGLLRLLLSVRGMLSVFLATTAAVVASTWFGFPVVECASGITLSMMGPFLSQEPTRQQRQRTLLVLMPAAIGANVLTAILHGRGVAGDSLFLLLVFACFLLAPRSQRGIGIGLVAIITTYIGLFLELPPSTLPVQVASQVVAVPIIAFVSFVILPVSPVRTLRRIVAAVQARAAQVIRHLQAARSGDAPALRRDLLRLSQLALAADDQVALLDPATGAQVRTALVDVELWTARLVDGLPAPADKRRTVRLGLHAQRIGRGRPYSTEPGQFAPGTALEALVGLGNAVHALGEAARHGAPEQPGPPRVFVPGKLAWRLAVRVTVAAGLAMAGGIALSPQRWFWAVITVYVVFLNARTRGDTIYRGVQRLLGTLAGIAAGLVLATALAGDTRVELVMLLGCVFGMYYFFLVSYVVGIFFVTVMLGILYGMLGAPLEDVLVLRLVETAVGAAAAMAVAAFVLPTRTRDQVRASGRIVLANLAAAVRAVGTGEGRTAALAAMRPVDRAVADLRLALAPLVAGRSLLRRPAVERGASALVECVHWTRMLAAEGGNVPPGAARDDLVADAASIADRLDTLARGAGPGGAATLRSDELAAPGRAIHGLDRAVSSLAERLESGPVDAFAMGG